jgi:hypothetical protein
MKNALHLRYCGSIGFAFCLSTRIIWRKQGTGLPEAATSNGRAFPKILKPASLIGRGLLSFTASHGGHMQPANQPTKQDERALLRELAEQRQRQTPERQTPDWLTQYWKQVFAS